MESTVSFVLIAIVLIIFNLFVICGNIFVIFGVSTIWKLKRSITTNFIISLAISDLFLGVFVLPFSLTTELLGHKWVFGYMICHLWLAVDVLLSTASIFNLVIIAFDRYLAICWPFKYPSLMSNFKAKRLVQFVWIFAFIICLPTIQLIFSKSSEIPSNYTDRHFADFKNANISTCSIKNSNNAYKIYSALGSFYIPLIILIFFYARIFSKVHETFRNIHEGSIKIDRSSIESCMRIHKGILLPRRTINSDQRQKEEIIPLQRRPSLNEIESITVDENSTPKRIPQMESQPLLDKSKVSFRIEIRTKVPSPIALSNKTRLFFNKLSHETKAARMLGIICGAFIICWLPFFTWYITSAFIELNDSSLIFIIFFWLGYLNSALNPIIYVIWSRNFRQAFKKLFCRLW